MMLKWAKFESIFDKLFSETKSLDGEDIASVERNFGKYFWARTAFVSKKMGENMREWAISNEVIDIVDSSTIEGLPSESPKMLDSFYIVFKNGYRGVRALWGGLENNHLVVCGATMSRQLISALFFIDFKNEICDFGATVPPREAVAFDNNMGQVFFKFITTFALLVEATNSPFFAKTERLNCSRSAFGAQFLKIKKSVFVKNDFAEKMKMYETVKVRGFLRNQAIGKGWSERRTIYIAPFERSQKE